MKYEIEVKSLLGSQKAADDLLKKLKKANGGLKQLEEQRQLNHYYKKGKLSNLIKALDKYFDLKQISALKKIDQNANSINVRSRESNGKVFLVVKGSLDKGSAVHSHRRMEFEEPILLTINELDALIEKAGFELEAKWSAERKKYIFGDMEIDIMFSPGYGYMAEFEKLIDDNDQIEQARQNIIELMQQLGCKEFDQELIERMYAHYNNNWQQYYGTRNTFVLE